MVCFLPLKTRKALKNQGLLCVGANYCTDLGSLYKMQLNKSRQRRVWNQTEGLDGIITK